MSVREGEHALRYLVYALNVYRWVYTLRQIGLWLRVCVCIVYRRDLEGELSRAVLLALGASLLEFRV